jgi:hypothetical protein
MAFWKGKQQMSGSTWRIVLAVVVGAHGLGHVLFLINCLGIADWSQSTHSWLLTGFLGDTVTRGMGSLLWLVALVGFISVAVGILGQSAWWRTLAIGASIVSLVAVALFVDKSPTQPALSAGVFDVVVLVALLVLRWPTPAIVGP